MRSPSLFPQCLFRALDDDLEDTGSLRVGWGVGDTLSVMGLVELSLLKRVESGKSASLSLPNELSISSLIFLLWPIQTERLSLLCTVFTADLSLICVLSIHSALTALMCLMS